MTDPTTGGHAEQNKSLVSYLYAKVYNGKHMSALNDLFAADYVEHNPDLENGRVALHGFLNKTFGLFPEIGFTLTRLVAEGDMVVAHALMRRTPGDRGMAVAEFFRISGDKIVEHWDITMPVPEETQNGNPMV